MTAATSLVTPDGHFLSATNPLATAEQRELERRALRILAMPPVVAGRDAMANRWRTIAGREVPAEAWRRFDELVEEFAFNYVLKAVNGDPNHPRLLGMIWCPPHEWFGLKVPGSRGSGGDGPDQHYAFFPVDANARYEVTGRHFVPGAADVPVTLIGNPSFTMTLGSLDLRQVPVAGDGTFRFTVGPEPADGRVDHLRTAPGAMYVFMRDCRADWVEVPNAYRVRRLDPPTGPPWTDEQVATRAAQIMVEDVAPMFWFMRVFAGLEPNTVTTPFGTGGISGLVSQKISFARLRLPDDQAYVFTMGGGGAAYRDIVLHDYWFRTIEYWRRTSSMNNAQGISNDDGTTTYVVAHADPGVHNWLDPAGLHELLVVHRWQGLPDPPGPDGPASAHGRLVDLADLDSVLPAGVVRVTPEQRRAQVEERLRSFLLRFRTD
ncbi:MAG TPA: hypothetical protein VGH89_34190 [Pseudonocardia sp.]|jgi:hypothetical protein